MYLTLVGVLVTLSSASMQATVNNGVLPPTQDFGQAPVRGAGSGLVVLNYSIPGITAAPGFALVYNRDFKIGAPTCTVSAGVNCWVSVVFQPQFPGVRQDALIVKDQSGSVLASTLVHGVGLAPQAVIYPGIITTFAGTGNWSYFGDAQPPTLASFRNPQGMAIDAVGNVFIADSMNQVIREVSVATGVITTVAGIPQQSGFSGDGGRATQAKLNNPTAVAVDGAGNLYIADQGNHRIRKVNGATGIITTVAGGGASSGADGMGDGGPATGAVLKGPVDVALDGSGNLYIADALHGLIRRVDSSSGVITAVAGGGSAAGSDGLGDGELATQAALNYPAGITVDAAGNLYIADQGHNMVRFVSRATGRITAFAGNGSAGYSAGPGMATTAELRNPSSVRVDAAGNVYIADAGNNVIRQVEALTGKINIIAGNGNSGSYGDGGVATAASLANPSGLALDSNGNIYIADTSNNVIRKVTPEPLKMVFGIVNIGLASPAQQLKIENIGNASLNLSAVTVVGNFQQQTSGYPDCSPSSSVAAGSNCTIAVAFVPTTTFSQTGTVTITTNTLNGSGASPVATLSGIGVFGPVPKVALSAANLVFGNQSVGTSATKSVTLTNAGTALLGISNIWPAGPNSAEFATLSNCGNTLAVGASCTVNVTFTPAAAGPRSATLAFNDSLPSSPQSVALTGTGIPSTLQISPSQITLSASVGGSSSTGLTLTNVGATPVTVASLSIPSSFSVTPQGRLPATLNAGASMQLTVAYTPVSIGPTAGSLILSTADGLQYTFPLSGNAYQITAGNFTLAQGASFNFGSASLVMQGDGNLVLYRSDGTPLWSTGTSGQNCGAKQCSAVFQGDGNFVVYNGGKPVWNSGTSGAPGAQLLFSAQTPQLEIVRNQSILWASVFRFSPGNFSLRQGTSLNLGYASLVMQGDGNLVLYRSDGTPLWSTGTYGQNCGANQCLAAFQGDGNFVVYKAGKPLWNSGTAGGPGAQLVFSAQTPQLEIVRNESILWANVSRFSAGNFSLSQGASINLGYATLVMQGDGNLVLYKTNGTPLWSTGTYGQNCGANQCRAAFQGDGNFVVYNGGKPLWNSGTAGNPGAQLVFSGQPPWVEFLQPGGHSLGVN